MEIREKIAEALIRSNGYDPEDSDQYTLALRDADTVLGTIFDLTEVEEEEGPLLGVVTPPQERSAVTTSAALFVFMETPPGEPTYVSDVRAWLEEIDRIGISDDTEVEGSLHLSHDVAGYGAEAISCGECDFTKDTVLYNHECS
jgi:hypothetical protein